MKEQSEAERQVTLLAREVARPHLERQERSGGSFHLPLEIVQQLLQVVAMAGIDWVIQLIAEWDDRRSAHAEDAIPHDITSLRAHLQEVRNGKG